MMYIAEVTPLCEEPATAMASTVSELDTESAAVYFVDEVVGVAPLVV